MGLLSNGGRVAAKFDLALTRNLVAAGVRLPQTSVALRFWVSEPQQLGPKLFANNVVSMPGGRKLEGAIIETSAEEGSEDQEGAIFMAIVVGLLAVGVFGIAALFAMRHREQKRLTIDQPLQGVSVHSEGSSAE